MKAVTGAATINEQDIKRFYRNLGHRGHEFTELRAIAYPPPGSPVIAFVNNENDFLDFCKEWNGKRHVYSGVNPRRVKGGTSEDVSRITCIPFDVDSAHPKREAATKEELKEAEKKVNELMLWMLKNNFKRPFISMSGNGYHLLQKVDIEITDLDDLRKKLENYFRQAPSEGLDSIFDLPRIIKVPGTMSLKGDDSLERPRRLSYIVTEGDSESDDKLADHIKNIKPHFVGDLSKEKIDKKETKDEQLNKKLRKLKPCFRRFAERGGRLSENRSEDHLLRLALVQEAHVCRLNRDEIVDLFRKSIDFDEKITKDKVNRLLKQIAKEGAKPWSCGAIREHEGCLGSICPEYSGVSRKSAATKLVEYCLESEETLIYLFHDQHKQPYARIKTQIEENTIINKDIALRSREFKSWLANLMWEKESKVPSNSALLDAINILINKATNGPQYFLNNRIAPAKDGIWIDIADKRNRVVKITANGWVIIENPPIIFRRFPHHRPLSMNKLVRDPWNAFEIQESGDAGDAWDAYYSTEISHTSPPPPSPLKNISGSPQRNATHTKKRIEPCVTSDPRDPQTDEDRSVWMLSNYLNIVEQDTLITIVHIILAFIPNIAHSILDIYGIQGSGKSFFLRIYRSLVDPSATPLLSSPKNETEAVQQLAHHWCAFYDNLSYIPHWLSDLFCRAVTGASYSKRVLFSDDDDFPYNLLNNIGLNGINIPTNRPDFLDRTLLIKTKDIDNSDRKLQQNLWDNFQNNRNEILLDVFDVISEAINVYPTISLDEYHRMADYMKWGVAVAVALGRTQEEYIKAFDDKVKAQIEESIMASPVGTVVFDYITNVTDEYSGTPADFYRIMVDRAKLLNISTRVKIWPKAPHILTQRLNDLIPGFKSLDIEVITGFKSHGVRYTKIFDNLKRASGSKIERLMKAIDSLEESSSENFPLDYLINIGMFEKEAKNVIKGLEEAGKLVQDKNGRWSVGKKR